MRLTTLDLAYSDVCQARSQLERDHRTATAVVIRRSQAELRDAVERLRVETERLTPRPGYCPVCRSESIGADANSFSHRKTCEATFYSNWLTARPGLVNSPRERLLTSEVERCKAVIG